MDYLQESEKCIFSTSIYTPLGEELEGRYKSVTWTDVLEGVIDLGGCCTWFFLLCNGVDTEL